MLPIEETPGYVKNIKTLAADKYQRDIDVWTYELGEFGAEVLPILRKEGLRH